MNLTILSPDKELYKGEVNSVQLPGIDGLFEILNNHAPLISVLGNGSIKIKSGKGEETIPVVSGIVEVLNNEVSVLVEGGTVAE